MNKFKNIFLVFVAALALTLSSCEKIEDEINTSSLKIAIGEITHSAVDFELTVEDDSFIAYIVDLKGKTFTGKEISEKGKLTSKSGKYEWFGLLSETEYSIYASTLSQNGGYSNVVVEDFKTLINTGEAATETSAGLRVDDFTSNDFTFTVYNGSQIDYSKVGIIETAIIENVFLDKIWLQENPELTENEILSSFLQNENFLTMKTDSPNGTATYKYSEKLLKNALPDASYTIFSVGVTDDGGVITYHDVTSIKVQTKASQRKGNPTVNIKPVDVGYASIKYQFIPNADCAYYAYFSTSKNEVDKYIKYFDNKDGEGAGEKNLKQLLRHIDAKYKENVDVSDVTVVYVNDPDKIDAQKGAVYSMLAIAMDEEGNLADTFVRDDRTLKERPENLETPEYSIKVLENSATSAMIDFDLEDNCSRIYWRPLTPEEYQTWIANFDTPEKKRKELMINSNVCAKHKDGTLNYDILINYALNPSTEYTIIAMGLGNYAQFSEVNLNVATFTTKELDKTSGTGTANVDIEIVSTSKTTAAMTYTYTENSRVLFHRITTKVFEIAEGQTVNIDDLTDKQIIDNLTSDGGEVWVPLYSNQEISYFDKHTWTGLNPGDEYVYLAVVEDADGKLNKLKRIPFSTNSSEGGVNPEVTELKINGIKWEMQGSTTAPFAITDIIVNNDVKEYKYVPYYDADLSVTNATEEERVAKLTAYVKEAGFTALDSKKGADIKLPTSEIGAKIFMLALPFGSQNSETGNPYEGGLKYVTFTVTE